MPLPDPPANDDARVTALQRSGVLTDGPVDALRAIADEAAARAGTPVGVVTFIGSDSAWIRAAVGMSEGEISRHSAFCAWAIHSLEVLWIDDTILDVRCSDNPLVLAHPFIRHYAGARIVTPEGYALGALCVMDYHPRTPDPSTTVMLEDLAARASDLLFRREARA